MPSDRRTTVDTLDLLREKFAEVETKINELTEQIKNLESAGIINASEWWKADRYLYLVFPTDANGKRVRQYIGSDPDAVEAARRKINNYKEWVKLREQREVLRQNKRQAVTNLDHALWLIGSTQRRLWG